MPCFTCPVMLSNRTERWAPISVCYTTKGGLVQGTINLFTVVVKSLQKLITILMPSICNLLTATVFINYKSSICYCCPVAQMNRMPLLSLYRCTMGYKWVQIPALVMKREQYECEYTDWAYHWHNRILWLVDAVQMFDLNRTFYWF